MSHGKLYQVVPGENPPESGIEAARALDRLAVMLRRASAFYREEVLDVVEDFETFAECDFWTALLEEAAEDAAEMAGELRCAVQGMHLVGDRNGTAQA